MYLGYSSICYKNNLASYKVVDILYEKYNNILPSKLLQLNKKEIYKIKFDTSDIITVKNKLKYFLLFSKVIK